MRDTNSVQTISYNVLCPTKASNGCPEHGKYAMTLPGLLSQHPLAFGQGLSQTEEMLSTLSPSND